MIIVPGILTDDIETLERQIELVMHHPDTVRNGTVAVHHRLEWVQIDFIDGEYADNKTITPKWLGEVKAKLSRAKRDSEESLALKFEAHLMVSAKQNFRQWTEEALKAGFERIMPQVESLNTSQDEFVEWINSQNRQAALSIDAQTPISFINKDVFKQLEVVQIMTIQAGFSGQEMKLELLDKVRELVVLREQLELDFLIEVDGGVHLDTIQLVKEAGADLAEVNSGLFGKGRFEDNLEKLIKLVGSSQPFDHVQGKLY